MTTSSCTSQTLPRTPYGSVLLSVGPTRFNAFSATWDLSADVVAELGDTEADYREYLTHLAVQQCFERGLPCPL